MLAVSLGNTHTHTHMNRQQKHGAKKSAVPLGTLWRKKKKKAKRLLDQKQEKEVCQRVNEEKMRRKVKRAFQKVK